MISRRRSYRRFRAGTFRWASSPGCAARISGRRCPPLRAPNEPTSPSRFHRTISAPVDCCRPARAARPPALPQSSRFSGRRASTALQSRARTPPRQFHASERLVRPGNGVALDLLELEPRLFYSELLVSARLLKHLPARCDAAEGAARRQGLDIRIE